MAAVSNCIHFEERSTLAEPLKKLGYRKVRQANQDPEFVALNSMPVIPVVNLSALPIDARRPR